MDATGPYQHCRPLTDEEYQALKADIEQNGIHEYAHVDENGEILVGHHRARAAGELGIEFPRHVVMGLTEQEKHEYAVRLESLGRAKDDDTKRWTVLNLWKTVHDPNSLFSANRQRLADITGVPKSTVHRWIKEEEDRLREERETNPMWDSSPTEPPRMPDTLGRLQPTSYQPRRPTPSPEPVGEPLGQRRPNANGNANGSAAHPSTGPQEPDARQTALHPPTPPDPPTLGDIMGDGPFDDAGLAEAEAARKRFNAATFVQVSLMRVVSAHGPEIMLEGERAEELAVLIGILDRLIDWLVRARALAADPRARMRRAPR